MTRRSDAEELLALEAEGVVISRNKNYYLFKEDGPRRALNLKRRIDALSRLVRQHRNSDGFDITIEEVEGKRPVELKVALRVLFATVATYLHPDELDILLRDPEVSAAVKKAGISVKVAEE